MKEKKELAVAALRNGTVIDHIPSHALFKAVELLSLADCDKGITIGNNLESSRLGSKGIIKVADTDFPEEVLSRIAIIAPSAVINVIRDYEVVEKRPVTLPDEVVGIVVCNNPKCLTRHEPMPSRFHVTNREPLTLTCHYCEHAVSGQEINVG